MLISNLNRPSCLFILGCLLLTACAGNPNQPQDWPQGIPERDYFLAAYEADPKNAGLQSLDQYLTWVQRFYQGWVVYSYGWNRMTEDLLAGIEQEEKRAKVVAMLDDLGRQIATEWSKSNESRDVKTPQMLVWGEALRESVSTESEIELIVAVDKDLQRIKAGQLPLSEIRLKRYFPELGANDEEDF